MNKTVYLIDVGVLLTPEDEEFESYAVAYDKRYGYYDEGQCYYANLEDAIKEAKAYVRDGVETTYAIVSTTLLDEDIDLEEACVQDEDYLPENVVFSTAKIDGQIIEGFIDNRKDMTLC